MTGQIIGNNTILGTSANFTLTSPKLLYGTSQEVVLNANQRVKACHLYWSGDGGFPTDTGNIPIGLYDVTTGTKTLISTTVTNIPYNNVTLAVGGAQWIDVTGLTIDLSAYSGKTIGVGVGTPATVSKGIAIRLGTVTGASRSNYNTSQATLPSTFTISTTSSNQAWSVYFETEDIPAATATPTGVSGTGTAGTAVATGAATAMPTGVSSTGNIGTATATGSSTAIPAGVSATGAVGTAIAMTSGMATPSGVSGTGSVGTATAVSSGTIIQSITPSPANIGTTVSVVMTGNMPTGTVDVLGTVTVSQRVGTWTYNAGTNTTTATFALDQGGNLFGTVAVKATPAGHTSAQSNITLSPISGNAAQNISSPSNAQGSIFEQMPTGNYLNVTQIEYTDSPNTVVDAQGFITQTILGSFTARALDGSDNTWSSFSTIAPIIPATAAPIGVFGIATVGTAVAKGAAFISLAGVSGTGLAGTAIASAGAVGMPFGVVGNGAVGTAIAIAGAPSGNTCTRAIKANPIMANVIAANAIFALKVSN